MTYFRSSRGEEVYEAQFVEETNEWICTCPSFVHRDACPHVEQLLRWKDWGMAVPDNSEQRPLEPPPSMGSWRKETTDGS